MKIDFANLQYQHNLYKDEIEEAILKNAKLSSGKKMDPRQRHSGMTGVSKIKAILVVHFAGHVCDMKAIMRIARKYKLKVIEDAAHAIPAAYGKTMVGASGNLTAFSLYATKNLTSGEGGMLTGPPALLKKARLMSLHGMSRDAWKRYAVGGSWHYDVEVPGFKYNMTDLQASIGTTQLAKLSRMQKKRLAVVRAYNRAFSESPFLQIPSEEKYGVHAWHLYVLRLNLEKLKISRDDFIKQLNAQGIGTSVHFIPIHLHSYFKNKYGFKSNDFPVAYGEYQRMISLPLYPAMTNADVSRVIAAVLETARKNKGQ